MTQSTNPRAAHFQCLSPRSVSVREYRRSWSEFNLRTVSPKIVSLPTQYGPGAVRLTGTLTIFHSIVTTIEKMMKDKEEETAGGRR